MNDLVHLGLALIAGVITGMLLIGAWLAWDKGHWSPRTSRRRGRL